MPDEPLGLFVTLSAYGNRLHGDLRGSVDEHNNTFGEPLVTPDEVRAAREEVSMRHAAVTFSEDIRRTIEAAWGEACVFRGWTLAAVNCRTNHVHGVVYTSADRAVLIRALKDRATRAVRAARLIGEGQPLWARGGSGRYLWNERDVEMAGTYVVEGQGPPLPGTTLWEDV